MIRTASQNQKLRTSCDTAQTWDASEMQSTVHATKTMYQELDTLLARSPKRFEETPRLELYPSE